MRDFAIGTIRGREFFQMRGETRWRLAPWEEKRRRVVRILRACVKNPERGCVVFDQLRSTPWRLAIFSVCVFEGNSAFSKAAERRQTVAHGASRGDEVRTKRKPLPGRQSWRSAPCAKFSVAPPGLACGAPGNPRLTPWATFSRRSAPPEYASAVRRASILYSQNGQSPVRSAPRTHFHPPMNPLAACYGAWSFAKT